MKIFFTFLVFILSVTQSYAAAKKPSACFVSSSQRFNYEKSISSPQENERITNCLKTFLTGQQTPYAKEALPILEKSNNLSSCLAETTLILRNAKDAQTAFAAASALASVPEEITPYQKQLFNIISSPKQPDYKKTLAVIVLSSAELLDSTYTSFLEPALYADDPVLQAYAAAAYTMLVPETKTRFLNGIITLYGFDKNFALTAFAATGLPDKQLYSALKEALNHEKELTRAGAAQWIGDSEDKKSLQSLFKLSYRDASTISAAANALASNYNLIQADLKKEMRSNPQSISAEVAVMTYALLGSERFDDIRTGLESLNTNQQANSARVLFSVAEILQSKKPFYGNAKLEEERIKKMIVPLGKATAKTKDEKTSAYCDSALKAIYDLINK